MESKQLYFYLTAAVITAIVLLSVFIVVNYDFSSYKYSVVQGDVEFVSNEAEPGVLLAQLKEYDSFVVAPQFVEKGAENNYMLSSLTMFITVLTFKQKEVISMGRILEKNELKNCQSNLGDVLTNKELSADDCSKILADSDKGIILIALPDSSLEKSRVVLEKGTIKIYPNSFDSVSTSSFAVLKNMYSDADSIIGGINSIVGNL